MSGGRISDRPKGAPNIVVVEDDPDVLSMVSRMLSGLGTVHTASDGMDAYALMRSAERAPDLLITDVMMPRMGGLDLVRRMKKDPKLGRVPVIMLTAKDGPRDVVEGINAGVRHYLTKPFKQSDLLSKAKKVLRIK